MPSPSRARWLDYLPVVEIAPADRNPKGHDLPGIGQSMRRLGYTEPIMLDERTGKLISGHGRLERLAADEAARRTPPEGIELDGEGRWLVPVVRGWASANDIEANMAVISANQLTIAGGWNDPATLIDMLQEAQAGPGLAGTGYTPTTLDQLLSAAEKLALKEEAKTPKPARAEAAVDLIFTSNVWSPKEGSVYGKGSGGPCCIAISSGWVYGCNSSFGACALAEHWGKHKAQFVDNQFTVYDHALHLRVVSEHAPKYATVRDAMDEEQCTEAGIEHYSLEQIIDWADELAEHAENVIVIPKYREALDAIPERFVLGYSIPSSHGGTPLPIEAFRGRRVHLLGGTPMTQFRYWQQLGSDVVSIDNNSVILTARAGQVCGPNGQNFTLTDLTFGPSASPLLDEDRSLVPLNNPFYSALVLSLGFVAAWYGKKAPDETMVTEGTVEDPRSAA